MQHNKFDKGIIHIFNAAYTPRLCTFFALNKKFLEILNPCMSNNMKGHSRWLDMDYTVTVILKSATIDIYLDKLYAKH